MGYSLLIWDEKVWLKDISKIEPKRVTAIMGRIAQLQEAPWPDELHVKKLHEFSLADFRLRVGDYRVMFNLDVEKKHVILLRVLHRSKAYAG